MRLVQSLTHPLHRYTLSPSQKSQKPRHYKSRFGEGRREFLKQQEEAEERQEYLRSLQGTFPSHVIDTLSNMDEKDIDLQLVLALVRHICSSLGEGAILIFLPGWDTISKLHDMLTSDVMFRSSSQYIIIPLHSMMPTTTQRQAKWISFTKSYIFCWYTAGVWASSSRCP